MRLLNVLVALLFTSSAFGKVHFPPPRKTDCSFYKSLELQLKCPKAPPNYLSGYGNKYCTEFQSRKALWSMPLKTWVDDTTFCLQKTLTYDESLLIPCSKIASYAFESHPRCYETAGFCRLEQDERKSIIKVVAIADIWSTLGTSTVQSLSIAVRCSLGITKSVALVASYLVQLVFNQADELKREAVALIEFIFSDKSNMDGNAQLVMAEILGLSQQSMRAEAVSDEIKTTPSLQRLNERCSEPGYRSNFCRQMTAAHGTQWPSTSPTLKLKVAREGLRRAYKKFGRPDNLR